MTRQCNWLCTVWVAIVVVSTLTMLGCESRKKLTWRQEVRTHDGKTIVIDRISEQRSGSYPENIVLEFRQEISFSNPNTGERISWELPNGLGIWMLDFDGANTYTVLKAKAVTDYNTWDCPNPPWVAYRHQTESWDRIPIEELPTQFNKPNMLAAANSDEKSSADGVVTVREFDAYVRRLDPPYQTISREKVNPIGRGCYPDTLSRLGRQTEAKIGYEHEEGKK